MPDPDLRPRRRRRLGTALLVAGAALCLVRARFAFEPTDVGPRRFEFGLQFGPRVSVPQPELVELAARLAPLRLLWALAALALGILVARRLGARLGLERAASGVLALGLALTAFLALDPGLLEFVAGRAFAGAPHYLEVEDLLRGLGVTGLFAGALLVLGPGPGGPGPERPGSERPGSEPGSGRAEAAAPGAHGAAGARHGGRAGLLSACLVALAVPLGFSALVLDAPGVGPHAPLTNDGRAYRWQAELFAAGHATLDAGPAADHFQARQILREGTRFASKYPPGHSLLLAPGAWLGERVAPLGNLFGARLIPLLLQACMPAIVFALARRLGLRRPLVAAWLYALSPTPLVLGALWLSHGTSLPFAALALLCGVRALDAEGRRGRLDAALCGLCLSVCGLARPGTGLAVALPLVVALAIRPRRFLRLAPWAVASALPALVTFAWIDLVTTGDALVPAYVRYAERVSPDDRWGLANLASAPTSLALNGARLGLWLHGFGASAALAWIGLAVWRGRHRTLLVGVPLALAGFYALLTFHGVPWAGPLYWVEAWPLLVVLSAAGLDALARVVGPRVVPLALAASALGSALAIDARAPLARAELALREAHVAADAAHRALRSLQADWVVEVPLDDPLDVKRRFLGPPRAFATGEPFPRTVFVVAGAAGALPAELAARPRLRFDPATGRLRRP